MPKRRWSGLQQGRRRGIQGQGHGAGAVRLGREEEYQAKLAALIKNWGNEWPSEVAQVYAYSGDAEAAFQWLDKALAQNEDGLSEQFLLPFYRGLHSDPRWQAFLERVGSSPAQLDAIKFEVALP